MSVFRSDGNFIYLDVPYCEFYIPMYYFDSSGKIAEDLGDTINVLGIFNVGIFDNGKLKELKTMNLPSKITINVYDSEVREVLLSNGEKMQCKVVKYLKNAKIMQSALFEESDYCKLYLNMLTGGKLPKIIPYSKLLSLWLKNQSMNGVNFGVSTFYLELILSVMYRNPENLGEKFAKIASNDGITDFDYAVSSIRQICQYNSTFTAITYEDMDSMITTSLNRSREKKQERESPVEQIIKF